MPSLTNGKYMWIRYKLTWANPTSTTYTAAVLEQISEALKDTNNNLSQVTQTAN